jgi:PAS domain S-box-containing protein
MENTEQRKKILIVEDEGIISLALAKALNKFGYDTIASESGESAVEIAVRDEGISLILMDIDLGKGMDGTEAARRILAAREIPIVFHTSHSEREMVEKVRGITRYGYVMKNTGDFVLQSSIEMAFELYDAYTRMKKSEMRHGNLFNNAPIGIFYSTIEGKIIEVNDVFARILGYSSPEELKEIINRASIAEILYEWPEERDYLISRALEAAGGWVEMERRYKRKDGSLCFVNIAIRVSQEDPGMLEGFFEDITKRRRAERLIAESEAKLHRIVSNSSDLICEIDEHGVYTYVSERYETLMGYSPDELIGTLAIKKMHPDDIDRAAERYRLLKSSGGSSVDEWRFMQKDGNYRIFECRSSMYSPGRGVFRAVVISHDITDRRQAEDELKLKNEELEALNEELTAAIEEMEATSEELADVNQQLVAGKKKAEQNEDMFRSLFENMSGGCTIYQVEGSGALGSDYVIKNINSTALGMTGKSLNQVIGKTIADMHPQITVSGIIPIMKNVMETGQPGFLSMKSTSGDHKLIYSENHIFKISTGEIVVISNDVTEQKSFEEALSKSVSLLRAVVQTIPDLVWLKDRDGIYLACNAMFERFFGAKERDIVGKTDYDFMNPELAEFFREHDRKAVAAGGPSINEEWITFADDGHRAMLETIKTPMYDKLGNLIGVLGIGRDITDRKAAEERIQSLLNEKELVLKEVHHRIKNNMNTIKALLLLQARVMNDPAAIAALHDAGNRVQSLMLLYDKLYRTDNFRMVSVRDYLSSLVDEIIYNFNNRDMISTVKRFDDFILDAVVLFPLGIIVNEIITNAMKYAFNGRTRGLIEVSLTLDGERARLAIKDNGAGMPESVTLKNAGFGLQLVWMLTEQIHGSVRIERVCGTAFVIEFNI